MAEKMILQFPVHAHKRTEFLGLMNESIQDTRNYEGCISASIWLPENDKGALWVYEEWESRDHQASYLTWRISTGMLDALAPFLTSPPQTVWLQEP